MVANEQEDVFRRAEEFVLEARRIVQQQKGLIVRLRAAPIPGTRNEPFGRSNRT